MNLGAKSYSSTCSANATVTQTGQCRRSDGTITTPADCAAHGVSTTVTTTEPNYSSCSNSWKTGSYVDPGSSCTRSETQTRSVTCKRDLDGQVMPDASCDAGTKPGATQTVADYSSCTYAAVNYGGYTYGSTCSSNTTRTQTAQCQRSNDGGEIVAASECTSRGVAVTRTDSGVSNYDSCGYSAVNWTTTGYGSNCSGNTTATQTAQCQRSSDGGQIVASSECTSRSISLTRTLTGQQNYAGCGYTWQTGQWGYGSTCSDSTYRSRSVWCQRTDGQTVADSYCGGGKPSTYEGNVSNTSQCTYYAVDHGVGACSGGQAPHYWNCTRSDGKTGFYATYCGHQNPEYQSTGPDGNPCP